MRCARRHNNQAGRTVRQGADRGGGGAEGGAISAQASRVTLAAAALMALSAALRASGGLFVSPLNSATGLGLAALSLVFACAQLAVGVTQPFVGAAADRLGAARVVAVGALVLVLATAAPAFSAAPAVVALALVAAAVAGGASSAAACRRRSPGPGSRSRARQTSSEASRWATRCARTTTPSCWWRCTRCAPRASHRSSC
jgi:hypothetical protein